MSKRWIAIKQMAEKYTGEIKLSFSTVVSQLLPMMVLPVIMQIVTPEGYGSYSLFYSVVAMVSPLLCLKYDTAIVTIRDDKYAAMLAAGCIILCLTAGAVTWLLLIAVSLFVQIPVWGWLLVPTVFFSGLHQGENGICLRDGAYGRMAAAVMVRSITLAVTQLALCRIFQKIPSVNQTEREAAGLAIGLMLSYFAGCIPMLFPMILLVRRYRYSADICEGEHICIRNIVESMRKYLPFVRFTFPAAGAASIASNILSPVISLFYGSAALGCYSVAAKALGAPITVISNPIAQVYFRDVSQKITGKRMHSMRKLLIRLAIPIYALLFLGAESVFPLFFGKEWRDAAWLIRLLIPLYAVRFVTVPFFSTAIAAGKQKEALQWQKRLLMAAVLSLTVILIPKAPYSLLMVSYSVALGWCSIAFCRYNFRILSGEVKKNDVQT